MSYKDKQKQREYQRNWLKDQRVLYMKDKSCFICGIKENLNIHHVDKFQKVSHNVWSWRKDKREKELEKCIILCEYHHREHHAEEMKKHGLSCYQKRGCRCEICRLAKSKQNKRFRNKQACMV